MSAWLAEQGRIEDIKRAAGDTAYRKNLLEEYRKTQSEMK